MSRKNQWQKKQSQNETKTKSQEKHQPSASQSQPELNKQHVSMKIYIIVMLKIIIERTFRRKKADFINLPVLIAEKK